MGFNKGESGNPGGRPKGQPKAAASLAKQILTETRDGAELVDYALLVYRTPDSKPKDKRWAHRWLSDRGFGRAPQTVEVISGDRPGPGIDEVDEGTKDLTTEQLEAMAAMAAADASTP